MLIENYHCENNISFESNLEIERILKIYNKKENLHKVYISECGYSYYEAVREWARRQNLENLKDGYNE